MECKHDYAEVLCSLFPGDPDRKLECVGISYSSPPKKTVRTIKSGAKLEDYARHLTLEAHEAVGVLGIYPTHPQISGNEEGYVVEFLACDFDTLEVRELQKLANALEEYRVHAYGDRGTTGRGSHLYVFLSEPMAQDQAHEAMKLVAGLSVTSEFPCPEIWPSSSDTRGKGIFLPYVGAREDGQGANPLIDLVNGSVIPISDIDLCIEKTEVNDLLFMIDDLASSQNLNKDGRNGTQDHCIYAHGQEAWQTEIERLKTEWAHGHRQSLALGATAFAIYIGVEADTIREDILSLEEASSDPEPKKRLQAVNDTLRKADKGRRVAWRTFYEKVGLRPPKASRIVSQEVLLNLRALESDLHNSQHKGMAGFTDFDVMTALIEVGKKYGKYHPKGVEVSISIRDLTLRARCSKPTVMKSLKRLKEARKLCRLSSSVGGNSGSLLLLVENRPVVAGVDLDIESSPKRGEEQSYIPMFRWGAGKLGKLARSILVTLQAHQPCTRADLAGAMSRKSRAIKVPVKRLVAHRLIEHDEKTGIYYLPDDFEHRLHALLSADGTLHTDTAHRERFERERKSYNNSIKDL